MSTSSATKVSKLPPPEPTTEDSSHKDRKETQNAETLRYEHVGVWTTIREVGSSWALPGRSTFGRGKDMFDKIPFVFRFFQECFSVGPSLVTVYFVCSLWESTESAVGLYFSSRLLDLIQQSILNQQVDRRALVTAVVYRLGFTFADTVVERIRIDAQSTLANRIRYLFEERLLQANLRLDLPTFEGPETAAKINRLFSRQDRGGSWEIFSDLLDRIHFIASVLSQVSFLFGVLRTQPGSTWFAALCLFKTALEFVSFQSYWTTPSYTWDSNVHYRRLASLVNMGVDAQHRIEIISNVLIDYIKREWKKARKLLGDVSDDHPAIVVRVQKPLIATFFDAFSKDFPLIFYAYQVSLSPASFSLTSVALMQQASNSLAWTISNVVTTQNSIAQRFSDIKTIYETSHIPNNLQEGSLGYPLDGKDISPGMEITFRNVSFAYPNSDKVIKDVSFTIRRGQTVIIVGVNGSGKSTLLKLFNRLYDPTSGTVLVDGVPMASFRASDLRRSSAMLFQKYSHFPLPIRENIIMGLPDEELWSVQGEKEKNGGGDDPVTIAARLGGAEEFVKKQSDGFDTVLKPHVSAWSTSSVQHLGAAFQKKIKEIKKDTEVSQGQWQRLALSRLFFRAAGKNIKLVAADEPSASLDPEMEYELFERLKELSTKKGKTMVFVTHRFGHLTKRADLILVMQGGRLVEQGKHGELLEMGGEYAKLYKLQADAFLPDCEFLSSICLSYLQRG